jgi:endonuclease III
MTIRLLKRRRPRNARRWRQTLAEAAKILVSKYGTPDLGNYRDPVKEIYYILLSAKTTERLYRAAYCRLWKRFPSLTEIACARVSAIRSCVEGAGLGGKRAKQVKKIAQRLLNDLGTKPSRRLRAMPIEEVYHYLIGLPGLGPKSALCVLMYSFSVDVFPVDANIQRVLCRMGAIPAGTKHYEAQQILPAFIPENLSRALHVVLIMHGRDVCRPIRPRCMKCSIRHLCKTGKTARACVTTGTGRSLGIDDNAECSS